VGEQNSQSIVIERVFDAPVEKVWEAWTNSKVVKKWWGPEGFTAPSIMIDFREGGKYIFAMRGPAGTEWDKDMYSAGVYKEIVPMKKIVTTDYFSDEEGNKADPVEYGQSEDTPSEMAVIITFDDVGDGKTKLSITYPRPENEAQFQAMLKSGMKQGWQSSLNKLAKAVEAAA
jgi:uncharacterized protein YndB with AHSA1/START domain